MTKKDIVRTIAEQIDLPQLRTKDLVQRTFDALIDALVQEGRIELRNFGVFQIKKREARMARNPRTGERVPVQSKSVVTFKPGKEMELRVRELDRRPSGDNIIANNHSVYEEMDDASEDDVAGDTE
jgi:integration host factor subunit beta